MKRFANLLGLFSFAVSVMFLFACNQSANEFALPPGDSDAGKAAFVDLGCNYCHTTSDVELKPSNQNLNLKLGGTVVRVKTYAELVTAVINPSHKISNFSAAVTDSTGQSKMPLYNDVMTVQELVDIVTYLQDEYELATPPTQSYYYPPHY